MWIYLMNIVKQYPLDTLAHGSVYRAQLSPFRQIGCFGAAQVRSHREGFGARAYSVARVLLHYPLVPFSLLEWRSTRKTTTVSVGAVGAGTRNRAHTRPSYL